MNNLLIKTTFRKAMAHTPRCVHSALTEAKIHHMTQHLMTVEDVVRCTEHPENRNAILAKYVTKYSKDNEKLERDIHKVFYTNPLYISRSEEEKKQVAEDMRYCYFAYGFTVDEYLFFDLENTNREHEKRKAFVSDLERLCFRFSANDFTESVLSNKITMSMKLGAFYKRDVVSINRRSDYDEYLSFVQKHSLFVEKKAASSRGEGVRLEKISRGGV